MSSVQLIAAIVGGLTIAPAIMVVLSKHPVRSVLYLIVTFFMLTANYVMLNAQFIAIVNIIVYAGAIMVLLLFVLMLLNLSQLTEPKTSKLMTFASTIAGCALAVVLIAALKDTVLIQEAAVDQSIGLVEQLGYLLFDKYVLPFEVSSILFISAMVGAILLSKKEKQITD